jgi:hypothetical protein
MSVRTNALNQETTKMATTLSIFEDNAGGLSILRHSDGAVFVGLECVYAAGRPEDGALLSEDETEYWLTLDTENAPKSDDQYFTHVDGHEFRFEEEGVQADSFENETVIAENVDGKWITYGNMGINGGIATGIAA